jgi:hypothetical protein
VLPVQSPLLKAPPSKWHAFWLITGPTPRRPLSFVEIRARYDALLKFRRCFQEGRYNISVDNLVAVAFFVDRAIHMPHCLTAHLLCHRVSKATGFLIKPRLYKDLPGRAAAAPRRSILNLKGSFMPNDLPRRRFQADI